MSLPEKKKVNCPKCGKEIEFTMWNSINTQMDFAVKDIISGDLFRIECPECGFEVLVKYPILFNDMNHGVMIQYLPPEAGEPDERARELIQKGGIDYRLVKTQEALREKTMIFNEGLDDRIIELEKILLIKQIEDQIGDRKLQEMYFNVADSGYRMELVLDGEQAFINVNGEAYDALAEDEDIKAYLEAHRKDIVIDVDWALDALKEILNESET